MFRKRCQELLLKVLSQNKCNHHTLLLLLIHLLLLLLDQNCHLPPYDKYKHTEISMTPNRVEQVAPIISSIILSYYQGILILL